MARFPTRPVLVALALALSPVAFAQYQGGQPYDDRYDPRYSTQQYPADAYASGQYSARYGDGYQHDRALHNAVHDAIGVALGYEARGIRIQVRGGLVYLSGSVRDYRVRALAHDIAHDMPGVRGVYADRLYTSRRYYN